MFRVIADSPLAWKGVSGPSLSLLIKALAIACDSGLLCVRLGLEPLSITHTDTPTINPEGRIASER